MKTNVVLQLQKLQKDFGSHRVLRIEACRIGEGIYWIQGENGSGKSTLFRILAGMLPFKGEILLNEQYSVRHHPVAYRSRVNFGEAEPLYPLFLTPGDLIRFTAKTRKASEEQCLDLIERFGISSYKDHPIGSCSSGMVKKLSLVLAFLGDPTLIILDEPLITIDSEAQNTLFGLIRNYRERHVSFLISSHQMFESGKLGLTGVFRLQDYQLVEV